MRKIISAFFITATGTSIGKTFVTAALCHQLSMIGKPVQALKPVISGYEDIAADNTDSGVLLQSMGLKPTKHNVSNISPWRFSAEISPDMAAVRENRNIDFSQLISFCEGSIENNSAQGTITLIEGVGGVLVPLNETHTVLDWIIALKIPTILVAGTYLGTISHTLTACSALTSNGVDVTRIVLSQSAENPVTPEETASVISKFLPDIQITRVARAKDEPAPWKNCQNLLDIIE